MPTSPHQSRPRLTLIGTVHRDPAGESRLAALLDELRPDFITLEMSPAARDYRQRQGQMLLQRLDFILDRLAGETDTPRATLAAHPAIEGIRTLLALPYEYRAAHAYATSANIPLELIDLSEVSLHKLRRIENSLITYRNLKTLVTLPVAPDEPRNEGYATARALLDRPSASLCSSFLAGCRGLEGVGPRDRHLGEELRNRLASGRARHLVHIGGWVHLIDDPHGETLFALLRDAAPHRVLLDGLHLDKP